MNKHAIVLADEEWCKVASAGKIKVYDFLKRKRGIYTLKAGSVCVVMTKAKMGKPPRIFGEFTAVEIKKVDFNEYNELAKKGYIYNPQNLKPKEKRWIILFNNFREYPNKVLKKDLKDIKTSTSKKPISEWPITGLSYIDQQSLEAIRKISGFTMVAMQLPPLTTINEINKVAESIEKFLESVNLSFSITHECVEMILIKMGKQLGFQTYTADPSRECNGKSLKEFVDMSKDELRKYAGEQFLKYLINVDVIWYTAHQTFYLFEIIIGGDMKDALFRFLNIGGLRAKMFIVADEDKKREYEILMNSPAFKEIKCLFVPIPELIKIYVLTTLWRQNIDKSIPLS